MTGKAIEAFAEADQAAGKEATFESKTLGINKDYEDLTPEQIQGLDAGLTQGGNKSLIRPLDKRIRKISKEKPAGVKYNPYGKGATANPSNMSGSTGP